MSHVPRRKSSAFKYLRLKWVFYNSFYLATTDTDNIGVVPACRVAEDDNQHEYPRQQLQRPAELEQPHGGGEADGEPDQDSQDWHHHCQPWEHCSCSEGWWQYWWEHGQVSMTVINTISTETWLDTSGKIIGYLSEHHLHNPNFPEYSEKGVSPIHSS